MVNRNIIKIGYMRINIDTILCYYIGRGDKTIIIQRSLDDINDIEIDFDNNIECEKSLAELDSLLVLNAHNYIRKLKIEELNDNRTR